jgi:nicotinate-nucleotide adenylyltransferase
LVVGLFGGSFDPIHHGHLIAGRAVAEELGLEQLRFMPTGAQPLKQGRHAASAADRIAMVEAAIAGESGLTLERAEVDRPGPSYTVETLRQLHAREPGTSFIVLLGADAVDELDRWREAAALPGLAQVVAFARPGSPRPVSPLLHRVVEIPAVEISSTAIRRRVASGLSIRYLVPDAVAAYIAAQGLYRNGHG